MNIIATRNEHVEYPRSKKKPPKIPMHKIDTMIQEIQRTFNIYEIPYI